MINQVSQKHSCTSQNVYACVESGTSMDQQVSLSMYMPRLPNRVTLLCTICLVQETIGGVLSNKAEKFANVLQVPEDVDSSNISIDGVQEKVFQLLWLFFYFILPADNTIGLKGSADVCLK